MIEKTEKQGGFSDFVMLPAMMQCMVESYEYSEAG
jgi:hypothetical protein